MLIDSRKIWVLQVLVQFPLAQFVLAVGFDTFEREGNGVEQENTFEEDYEELFGFGTLDEDSKNFDASLEYWGEERESMILVPEMSTGMMN